MQLTIVSSGVIKIDNIAYQDFDMSSLDPSINAIQWWDTAGEIEIKDVNAPTNRLVIIRNDPITDITPYQSFVDMWNIRDQEVKAAQLAQDNAVTNP